MPLWKIYHPPGAYSSDDKTNLSEAITSVYGRVMPRFYVGVIFEAVEAENFYIGGKSHSNFVRISVEHIARALPSAEAMHGFIARMNKVLAPWVNDRGFDWELHVDETPFDLWTIQGYLPPREGTEDEKRWISENRASPRTHP